MSSVGVLIRLLMIALLMMFSSCLMRLSSVFVMFGGFFMRI